MISIEELAGVVDVLGITNEDELYAIFKELIFSRKCKIPSRKKVKEVIRSAIKEHWIEAVHGSELIVGPCAFPEVPDDLSEVIDILKIDVNRKIEWDEVASAKIAELKSEVETFSKIIDDQGGREASKKQIIELESEYQHLMGLCYDFEFWLTTDFTMIKAELRTLSQKLESLKI
ncbi:MAG: hypothetical protein PHS47_05570 [Methanocellales archaeon]|nr:hypothetical protein [Methanocellales archaeon]MDD3421749.1 hypothetical protein [Methanocellales archaeon]MDD4898770.1 hypothetical protein [Methanocellales archaeon]MDD5446522.1 hypothetical protein [Methanocellales archaeon]